MENSVVVAILQLLGKFEAGTLATIIIFMILSPFGVICLVVFFGMWGEKKRNAEVLRFVEQFAAYREEMDTLLEVMRKASEDHRKETSAILEAMRKAAEEHQWANSELVRIYREDTKRILESHGRDINELGEYYKTNVELVHSWRRIAEGFQETVVLNTATMQRMCDMMQTNQFCPNARLPK